MTISRVLPLFIAALGVAASAAAAELPSRKPKPPEAVKTCEIGGKPGYLLPGGDVCLRLSGYVSAQISGGSPAK
jgi:hypothetical protein